MLSGRTAAAQGPWDLPADHPDVHVLDDSGAEVSGRLLRFDDVSLTLLVQDGERRVERERIRRVWRRDELRNGLLTGLFIGVAAGVAAGLGHDTCRFELVTRPCRGYEKSRLIAFLAPLYGAVGLGIGAGVDALIRRPLVLYERPGVAMTLTPAAGARRGAIGLAIAW
jgi:hypothetical protein